MGKWVLIPRGLVVKYQGIGSRLAMASALLCRLAMTSALLWRLDGPDLCVPPNGR